MCERGFVVAVSLQALASATVDHWQCEALPHKNVVQHSCSGHAWGQPAKCGSNRLGA